MDFIRTKWGLPIRDIWFTNTHEAKGFSFINIEYNFYEPIAEGDGITLKKWQSQTLVSDIAKTPEEILANFKSKVRNEIRRAEKEGIKTTMFSANDTFTGELIDSMSEAYIAMYRDKGQKTKGIAKRLRGIAKSNRLKISVAYLQDNTVAAYHSYVVGDGIARLLHSVSIFREEPEKRKMIGWANRLLHYKDMCVLRGDGNTSYDWGGISRDEKMENITRFKEEFCGGERVVFYRLSISY